MSTGVCAWPNPFFPKKLSEGDIDLCGHINATRAKGSETVPIVLSHQEVELLLNSLRGKYKLMAQLLHGSGLRLMGRFRLLVKDVDLDSGLQSVKASLPPSLLQNRTCSFHSIRLLTQLALVTRTS
jgi:integrase